MLFSRLLALFTGSRHKDTANHASDAEEAERFFARRHHSFKLFLTAWNKFQETMTEVEYSLCCDHPFGLYRVRNLCTRTATQVFQCIQQLERMDPAPCPALYARFAQLQTTVVAEVYPPEFCLMGPKVLPLDMQVLREQGGTALVDPCTLRLENLRKVFPQAVPEGFVITAAGCESFFQSGDLQDEINRRIQAAGGFVPETLAKLSRSLSSLVEETALPEDLSAAILSHVHALQAKCPRPMRLLLRGRLWPLPPELTQTGSVEAQKARAAAADAAAATAPSATPTGDDSSPDAANDADNAEVVRDPGLLVWGPAVSLHASDAEIMRAVQKTLAGKERAQALVYRRARGLTDDSAGLCVTCMAVEEELWGGLAQTGNPVNREGGRVYVYACDGLPQDMEYSDLPVDMYSFQRQEPRDVLDYEPHDADRPVLEEETARRIMELALTVEEVEKQPLSLTWVCNRQGGIQLLQVRPIVLARQNTDSLPNPPARDLPSALVGGGTMVSPGRVCAAAHPVRTWEDALHFPQGAILIVPDDRYLWVGLFDRAAGIIAERGLLGSRLGTLAREFGKPAVFGMKGALDVLSKDMRITLCADTRKVYAGQQDELLAGVGKAPDFMPGSPVFRMLQHAGKHILPLTVDVDSLDFKAANCTTYHDIARYCHEKAVSSMFALGSEKQYAPQRIKQLRDSVLKQFWVINLSNGFATVPNGPVIDVEQIDSRPMLALWKGMNAHPWQGPPPVDGKGFLSVLFEATANPNLDPAAQSSYFTEKNYFMISRDYCSLHSRFGFHFVSVEARLGERKKENYLLFQLRGGAANIERRILRVRFVADLLWEFGFAPVVRNDAVTARLEGMDPEEGDHLLAVAGYMTIHTRQLDMIMQDSAQVAAKHEEMLNHCRALFTGRPLTEHVEHYVEINTGQGAL